MGQVYRRFAACRLKNPAIRAPGAITDQGMVQPKEKRVRNFSARIFHPGRSGDFFDIRRGDEPGEPFPVARILFIKFNAFF